jgi:phage baseplate assembly protein W
MATFQEDALPSPNVKTVNVVWLDVNSRLGVDVRPDLLPNVQAVNNSLYNLLRCPIGARGPIFEPEYGTILYRLLHEPLDVITANKIKIAFVQAIQKWEPRINIDLQRSTVIPDYNAAAFRVIVYYTLVAEAQQGTAEFLISV